MPDKNNEIMVWVLCIRVHAPSNPLREDYDGGPKSMYKLFMSDLGQRDYL